MRNLPYILIVGTFRPGGDTRIGMKLDLLSLWLCSVPLTTLAAFVFKLPFIAVFAIMYAAEDYLKAILCVKYYFTYNWLRPVTDQGIKGLEEFYESRRKKPADIKPTHINSLIPPCTVVPRDKAILLFCFFLLLKLLFKRRLPCQNGVYLVVQGLYHYLGL